MERIWKLAVYIFWIVASTALILLAYVLSGNQYSPFANVMVYAGLAGLAIGIFGGFIPLFPTVPSPRKRILKNKRNSVIRGSEQWEIHYLNFSRRLQ